MLHVLHVRITLRKSVWEWITVWFDLDFNSSLSIFDALYKSNEFSFILLVMITEYPDNSIHCQLASVFTFLIRYFVKNGWINNWNTYF